LAAIFCSCASASCPPGPEQNRIIQANHIAGGDAPTIDSLEAYKSGLLRLNHVGTRIFCSTATEEQISEISSLVDPALVQELEWTILGVHDAEWIQIFADGAEARLLLQPAPEELTPLLRALDALFREHFGRRYDNPLLSE
jgi:hypothetical protein